MAFQVNWSASEDSSHLHVIVGPGGHADLGGGAGGPAVVVSGVAVGVGVTAIKYNKIILILSKNTNFSHNFFSESESYWNFYV